MEKYKPLPDGLRIDDSKIHDQGLFTTKKFDKMDDLGISHIKIGRELYRTPLGGFINHSDKPNCQKIEVDNKWYLQTLRDIKKGEEITLKYTFYKV